MTVADLANAYTPDLLVSLSPRLGTAARIISDSTSPRPLLEEARSVPLEFAEVRVGLHARRWSNNQRHT